jgi:AraC family transcriptional regulator
MGLFSQILASGAGWRVTDVICSAGPHDRPFEECHDDVCVAVVMEGTFQYRSAHGAAMLGPGSLLLGNAGQCFQCGHEHGVGDRCLSFRLAPEHFEAIAEAVPGVRRLQFDVPRLPPTPLLASVLARIEAARDDGDTAAFAELTVILVGAVAAALNGSSRATHAFSRRDERRVAAALRRIEALVQESLQEPFQELFQELFQEPSPRQDPTKDLVQGTPHGGLGLNQLASDAAMSPYHFLRTFRRVVGMTPHQFVLHTRLHRAAVRLLRSAEPVSAVAFDVGFNDLSTFNNRFRRVMGVSPSAYRARRGG